MDICILNLQFHHFYIGANNSITYSGLELNSVMANHHASCAGNKIPHSLSKYAISHSGCCKNRVNLRRCICLDRKKKSSEELQELSFSCNFTRVATTKFSEQEFLSLTISMERSSGRMHVLYINPLTSIMTVPIYSHFPTLCFSLFQLYVSHHDSTIAVGLKHWHLCVRCSKLGS